MKTEGSRIFKTCPKTGRIVSLRKPHELPAILFPVAGFLALVWYLVRVLPKPSRAAYPCQKVAAPLAGSFLVWLAGVAGASLALRYARGQLRRAHYWLAALALVGAGTGVAGAVLSQGQPAQARPLAYDPHPVNSPIGTAKGLMPGRVAWAHNPLVTDWDGTGDASDNWYDHIDQAEATKLMQWALTGYANTTTTAEAWEAIFLSFNGGSAGYQPTEKIFVKMNLVTSSFNPAGCTDASYNWIPSGCYTSWTSVGQSPQVMVALLDQLVNVVGVAQSDITIGDSTGLWINELYDVVHGAFPDVHYLDARGTLGRTKAVKSTTRIYWSTDEADGKNPDYLLQAVVDAKYIINMSLFKAHEYSGVTLTAKNHFGSFSGGTDDERKPDSTGYYSWHLRLPMFSGAGAWAQRASMAQYRPLVDMNGHTGMGGKTLLYLIDAVYGGKGWAGNDASKWSMAPFNDHWPSSVFLSMDQVAIDSVAFDFLSQKWPDLVLATEGAQDYLHEMALANSPPSGTLYDPEDDGTPMASQGVHEHWNDATDKQYTRNLGTGNGIELVYVTGSPLGGVNGDSVVDSTDALIILSADAGIDTSQYCPMNCGDVNGDGLVNSTDALVVLSYDVGMTVPFAVGQPGCPASVTQPPGCTTP
jgi:Domain of unknown function (DUF362)/Dockerin type I domain